MASPPNNTTNCTSASRAAAQSVYDKLKSFPDGLPWTITIKPERFGDCSVITVTTELLEDTQTAHYYDGWLTTLTEEPAGTSRPRRKRRVKEVNE
jgi:hypothetical protein